MATPKKSLSDVLGVKKTPKAGPRKPARVPPEIRIEDDVVWFGLRHEPGAETSSGRPLIASTHGNALVLIGDRQVTVSVNAYE